MPGERVLLIDSSAAVQEIGRTALEEAGFRVFVGSNGVAALTAPDVKEYDVIVLDIHTEGVDGYLATHELRTGGDTHQTPILLLIPEEEGETRGNQSLRGANGYLLKPFNPVGLVGRVRTLIEERDIHRQCDDLLRKAAENFMENLAQQHIRNAVENKTQIIVERAIQNIVSQLDQRINREVTERMTRLSAEREQELVRATVHEVAQSMVEKLAERKVSEAIEGLLADMTDKSVKKSAETAVPAVARKQVKESLESVLPREIDVQVRKAMDTIVPDVSKKMVLTIEGVAQKIIPKAAREKLPELTERHVKASTEKVLPEMVQDLVAHELDRQISDYVGASVRTASTRINRRTLIMLIVALVLMLGGIVLNFLWTWILVGRHTM